MKKINDRMIRVFTRITAWIVLLLMILILGHIVVESIPAFVNVGGKLFDPSGEWRPVSKIQQFSLVPAILGTLYVSFLGVVIALILGISCSLFLNFYMPKKLSDLIHAWIDLVAGIPSVIFGFIGLTVLVKQFQIQLKMPAGQCILAAAIVLGIMLIPFVVSNCSESIQNARREYEHAALALGFSKEMMILTIILPAIRTGMVAAFLMAFGRGLGETMAVMMVIGNSPILPKLMGRGQTIAALTALEMGSIEYGSTHLSVLYAANAILLFILFVVLGAGYLWKRRMKKDE